jgi:DNA polymerase (family X)
VKNSEIARVFEDIASLLELKGENRFKVRAYQRAARSIEFLPKEIEVMLQQGEDLRGIAGVGEAISKKAVELVTTGRLSYYEELQTQIPPGTTALLEIPGIGPKIASKLASELKISGIDELEQAILNGRVATLAGLGSKTADNIMRQIQSLRRKDQRMPIGQALPIVEEIIADLGSVPGIRNLTAAGSLRRFRETVGDIDLMGTADNPKAVIQSLVALPHVREILAQGPTKATVILLSGIQLDLRMVEHGQFGSLLQYFTGNKGHNIALRTRGQKKGLKLSEYGITDLQTGKLETFANEKDFYARLGLAYIPPEIREDQGEIALAERNALPNLIQLSDVLCDLHVHTDWSDGNDSIETMARAAKRLGYRHLAITDHSFGRGIARGLDEKRLRQQIEEIQRINQRMEGIRILTGTEVDIRADGSLDLPDDILAELDVVVASIHSGMRQEQVKITRRVIGAIENPHVDIIGHPTCRIIAEREPIELDMEAVFRAAAHASTVLEINATPSRMDLKDSHAYRARELGVKLSLGSDAHSADHLEFMRYGIGVARRAFCQPETIINTWPLRQLTAFLKRPR